MILQAISLKYINYCTVPVHWVHPLRSLCFPGNILSQLSFFLPSTHFPHFHLNIVHSVTTTLQEIRHTVFRRALLLNLNNTDFSLLLQITYLSLHNFFILASLSICSHLDTTHHNIFFPIIIPDLSNPLKEISRNYFCNNYLPITSTPIPDT